MDFYKIITKEAKGGVIEISPNFTVGRFKDLMIRGGAFYAVWDEEAGLWNTDLLEVPRLVDAELWEYRDRLKEKDPSRSYVVRTLSDFDTGNWNKFLNFVKGVGNYYHQLDDNLTFADADIKKTDYVSRRLPYSLAPGDYSAWDELVGTLYSVEERAKIEWGIGAVVAGDSKKIQKFIVLYGPGGTGKSTILDIIWQLFDGYVTAFEASELGKSNNSFATEAFRNNPLVAIQHDGDLSKIQDNTKLNSIVSHEEMTMNEKYKSNYTARVNAFLFMGTNTPVKISDAKSGIIRRLIDVHPTGVIIPRKHYDFLMSRIKFELGAIAHHCLEVYQQMGKNYYGSYRPVEMMLQTDVFFNFIEANFDIFKDQGGTSLKQAYTLYKEYCNDTGIEKPLPQYKFREELRNYFDEFHERGVLNGENVRSLYLGFSANKFKEPVKKNEVTFSLVMDETESLLDELLAGQPAQYGRTNEVGNEVPEKYWSDSERLINGKMQKPKPSQVCNTKLRDLDTTKLHFVKVPENHIVIDFDLKDVNGAKSLERNLEAASVWPPTYAELSKGGSGVHLHYTYEGDVSELSSLYSDGIEIKTLLGDASLRRRLSSCNNIPVSVYNGPQLPLKEKKVLQDKTIKSEKGLRDLIARNLRKEINPGTKPSIDFIKKILDDAYESGMAYDLTDLRPKIMAFANNSTNQPLQCLKTVQQMKFASENGGEREDGAKSVEADDDRLVFYDLEVYPNLFVVCWKFHGDTNVVKMINPTPMEVEGLFKLKLVGFNNRRYDNHILYARYMGYTNEDLYKLSQKIIDNTPSAMFGEAYNISYTDIYDFSSKKQGLKKFQIELGIPHKEMDIPWDQPVPDDRIDDVVDYCANDVISTEAVFESRMQDFVARQVLADLSGLTVNDTTQKHTGKIIFGNDRNPQQKFVYTDLSKEFPGYDFDATRVEKSIYRGEEVGEGGYVYAEPGIYENVVVLDVASMHPTSIEQLNLFGEYTPKFSALKAARIAIKHGDYDTAKTMLDGKLAPYLKNPADADALSYALKIVINIVYGLTSAKFDNAFRDIRNVDNIVAKRGALFMIDLKKYVQEELKLPVVHIKTDSIKVPIPKDSAKGGQAIIEAIENFGAKYGYDFEHEATYDKFCLVNDAVYIARYGWAAKESKIGTWDAVGAQFQHPYVFKTLFSGEDIEFRDLCETKQVTKGAMYLDFEHDRPAALVEGMQFVGRTGRFVPVTQESGGAVLYRVQEVDGEQKLYSVTGTKGYLWMEAEMAESLGDKVDIDMSYFDRLEDEAIKTINKYGSFEDFVK